MEEFSAKLRNLSSEASKTFLPVDVYLSVISLENMVDLVTETNETSENFFQSVDNILDVSSKVISESQNVNSTSKRYNHVN